MAISFIAAEGHTHGSNTAFDINKPTDTQEGDLMVTAVVAVGNALGAPAFTMSDWTELETVTTTSGDDGRCSIYYRVATSGDSGTTTWTGSRTQGGAGTACAVITATYRGIDTSTPILNNTTIANSADPGTLSSGTVNNTNANAWAVGIGGAIDESNASLNRSAGDPTTNRGGVQALDNTECAMVGLWDSNGTVATGNRSFTASETGTTDRLFAATVLLNPAPEATNANAEATAATAVANAGIGGVGAAAGGIY